MEFARLNNLCHGYTCRQLTGLIRVRISLDGQFGNVRITPMTYEGWSPRQLRTQANVTSANNVNSFNLLLIDNRQYFAPNVNSIQIGNVFANPLGTLLSSQLYFRGIPLAVGQLQGQRYY